MCRVLLVRGFFIVRGVVDDNGLRIVQKASRKEGSRFTCGKHDEIPKFQVKKNLTLTFEKEPLIFQTFDLGAIVICWHLDFPGDYNWMIGIFTLL